MNKLALFATVVAVSACSSTPTTPAADAGPGETGGNTYAQTGQVVDFNNPNKGIPGVTITAGAVTATTDAAGKYTLNMPKNTPFSMTVSAPNYLKLLEQEWSLSGDADRGKTHFVDLATQQTLQNALSGYDVKLATVSILVELKKTCASEGGATIVMANQGTAVMKYFKGGFPSNVATSVTAGELPSAVIYNLPPGAPVQLTITHPTCKQVAFPTPDTDAPNIVYTGNVTTEAGNSAGVLRYYLE